MDWSEVAEVVRRGAPLIGTLLGGPAGAAVGSLVAAALGVSDSPDEVTRALQNNPEAIVKVQQIEADQRVKLQELAVTAEANRLQAAAAATLAEVDDRKSARSREVDAKDSITPQILAGIVVACSVGIGVAIVTGWVTKDPQLSTLLGTVVGYVFGESKQVLAYYFGSSAGSAAKSKQLAKITPIVDPNAAEER